MTDQTQNRAPKVVLEGVVTWTELQLLPTNQPSLFLTQHCYYYYSVTSLFPNLR